MSGLLLNKNATTVDLPKEFEISKKILKKQIDYKFKSQNGQVYSRLVKMKKLVKNIFFRYPNEDVVFSIFPMKGEVESKSYKEIEIYCFGKKKLRLKDKLVIGRLTRGQKHRNAESRRGHRNQKPFHGTGQVFPKSSFLRRQPVQLI